MALVSLNTIKNWFRTNLIPNQNQWWDVFDSFRHKSDKVASTDIDGLDNLLAAKASTSVLTTHTTAENAHAALFGQKVDKIAGKVLSDLNYSLPEKEKLAGLEAFVAAQIAGAVVGSTSLGSITPASTIPATINVHGFAAAAGTYSNCGGMIVPANSIAFLSRVGGVWTVSATTFDVSGKVNVSDVINTLTSTESSKPGSANNDRLLDLKIAQGIPEWSAKPFLLNDETSLLGKFWRANANTLNTEIPGISVKWVEILTAFSKTEDYKKEIFGDYFNRTGFYFNKTTAAYASLTSLKSTEYIPFIQGNTLVATGTTKGINYDNITFFTSDKIMISGINIQSNVPTLTINSGNTPANTAFIVLNASLATITKVTINNSKSLSERVDDNVNSVALVAADTLLHKQQISGYFTESGYRNLSGSYISNNTFRSTKLIPFIEGDVLIAIGTAKGTAYANINFYDASQINIGSISNQSTIKTLTVNFSNTPSGTQFISLNALTSAKTLLKINGKASLAAIANRHVMHHWFLEKWTSYGDSITAANYYQQHVVNELGCISTVRGVGSSAVTANFTGVAVEPTGQYINRRSNYNSDLDFNNALSATGFTNLVTTPTWIDYSNNPAGYSLPSNSYFLINAQASHQDRINTLPTDSEVITILFGTNDEKNDSYIGSIDDFGNSDNGLNKNFIGSYRLMLSRIATRCPIAKVVLIVPPKMEDEYNFTTNQRTALGVSFDKFRDAIRLIGTNYGYEVVDGSKELNFTNIQALLTDGIHPTQSGYKALGENIARKLSSINISLLT